MNQPVAFLNGQFCPASELALSVNDLGVLQGIAVSERMRTFSGELFRLDDHLDRLDRSLEIIDVRLAYSAQRIGEIAHELLARNRDILHDGEDFGLSLFVTPGNPPGKAPTFCIECYRLPFEQWASYYTAGQALLETGIRQVPESCWPPALKCRSRMHYFLADKRAHQTDPGARAVLLDLDDWVTEASTANIVFFRADVGLVSPPLQRILPGVSLAVLEELASALKIPWRYEDVRLDDLTTADEILLCSTSPCVWPVTRLNRQRVGSGSGGPVFRRLLDAWSNLVGLDIAAQARQCAKSP